MLCSEVEWFLMSCRLPVPEAVTVQTGYCAVVRIAWRHERLFFPSNCASGQGESQGKSQGKSYLSKAKPSPVQSKLSPAKGKTKPSPKTKGKGKEKAIDSKEKTVTTKGAQKNGKTQLRLGMGILCCARRVQNNKETGMYIDVSIL